MTNEERALYAGFMNKVDGDVMLIEKRAGGKRKKKGKKKKKKKKSKKKKKNKKKKKEKKKKQKKKDKQKQKKKQKKQKKKEKKKEKKKQKKQEKKNQKINESLNNFDVNDSNSFPEPKKLNLQQPPQLQSLTSKNDESTCSDNIERDFVPKPKRLALDNKQPLGLCGGSTNNFGFECKKQPTFIETKQGMEGEFVSNETFFDDGDDERRTCLKKNPIIEKKEKEEEEKTSRPFKYKVVNIGSHDTVTPHIHDSKGKPLYTGIVGKGYQRDLQRALKSIVRSSRNNNWSQYYPTNQMEERDKYKDLLFDFEFLNSQLDKKQKGLILYEGGASKKIEHKHFLIIRSVSVNTKGDDDTDYKNDEKEYMIISLQTDERPVIPFPLGKEVKVKMIGDSEISIVNENTDSDSADEDNVNLNFLLKSIPIPQPTNDGRDERIKKPKIYVIKPWNMGGTKIFSTLSNVYNSNSPATMNPEDSDESDDEEEKDQTEEQVQQPGEPEDELETLEKEEKKDVAPKPIGPNKKTIITW